MAGINQDKYTLGQSIKKSITGLGQEIRLDLSLKPNPNLNAGTIIGTIKDPQGNPIPGATIKVMDADYNPIAHTTSGQDGSYIFSPFPPSPEYHLFCQADGYLLGEQLPFPLNPKQTVEKNFTMQLDPAAQLSTIAGDVMNSLTPPEPVDGAVVNLYSVDAQGNETLIAITYTNEFGQFTFREVQLGSYIVRITALGYLPLSVAVSVTQPGSIIKVLSNLNVDPEASKGTVSGKITDENNVSVAGADVILYKVENDGKLTPVAVTKTNTEGVYLFTKVPQGDYKIKSTKTVSV